ncbi:MAG TPA: nucleotidyltransferase family protein [Candidatus Acidoferrales bacterium]|nr:nucleotidyltransferase family protein [Candidatus Acidoferrales bacterium]
MTRRDVSAFFITAASTIADAIASIDRSGRVSLALVVDENRRLVNTLTDGDVRRGILAGLSLSDPVSLLLERKRHTPHPDPVTALASTPPLDALRIMHENMVRQLPLLDETGVPIDIVIVSDFLTESVRPIQAVVMAGGQGSRLRPLTEAVPKPMLPVGGKPVMEFIVDQLREVGVKRIHVATHYQAEKIMDHFGDGRAFGVEIEYVHETRPLGTGGALGLLHAPTETTLIINGDILTRIDLRSFCAFHYDHGAEMTVGVRRYEVQVPYGVVDCDGPHVKSLREKPQLSFFVNAGIYLVEPSVFTLIPTGEHLNITDLVETLVAAGRPVVSYPICEYWLDIGHHEDYRRAQEDARKGKLLKSTVRK